MPEKKSAKITKKFLLDLIFPNRCPFCDKVIVYDRLCCGECHSLIEWADGNICGRCGVDGCVCGAELWYDRCYVSAYFRGTVKKGVLNLKRNGGINFALISAERLYSEMKSAGERFDCIVPVPMDRKKRRKNGYNHALEICAALGALFGDAAVTDGVILKSGGAPAQHTLGMKERLENVRGLYYAAPKANLTGKRVLLCDDVITTGATVNECARVLCGIGAASVVAAVASAAAVDKDAT